MATLATVLFLLMLARAVNFGRSGMKSKFTFKSEVNWMLFLGLAFR
jgi:hypothetical protein